MQGYYRPGTTGWGASLGGLPIYPWDPHLSVSLHAEGAVSCNVTGTPDIELGLDAASDITSTSWTRLTNAVLSADGLEFTDTDAADEPVRFYRVAPQ
jgi:hypothetical protein